jgi:hypothetical protein
VNVWLHVQELHSCDKVNSFDLHIVNIALMCDSTISITYNIVVSNVDVRKEIWEHTSNMFSQTHIQNSSFNTKYTVKTTCKSVLNIQPYFLVTGN